MAFEQRELTGALFPNDDKSPGDNRPDYRGKCKIEGEEYFVSAWSRTARSGVEYFSLAFQHVEAEKREAMKDTRSTAEILDDGLPF
jgi:uncharacterized protein (DUF736 family)